MTDRPGNYEAQAALDAVRDAERKYAEAESNLIAARRRWQGVQRMLAARLKALEGK